MSSWKVENVPAMPDFTTETSSCQRLTSLISLILDPPLPMREPHWLAGMTNRKVTGGLLVTVPLATKAVRS